MINVSSEFKRLIYSGKGNFIVDAVITLDDGTVLNVSNSRIMSNGLEIDDAIGSDDDFNCIGSTIINGCELILYNNDEIYSDYDFINAKVNIAVKVMTSAGYETVQKGTYTVDNSTFSDISVTLSLLDNMCQFDRPYASQSLYNSPVTILEIVRDACTKCGVLFTQSTIPNGSLIVNATLKEDTTYRDVIGWCAAIAGCFARCTTDGKLEFAWFDTDRFSADTGIDGGVFDDHTPYYTTGDTINGGTFNPWNDPTNTDGGLFTDKSGLHHITSLNLQNIGVDDVVITAVKIEYEVLEDNKIVTKTYPETINNDAYVITVSNIPFINADNVVTIYNTIASKLIGLSFRTCNITHTADPSIEAGDVAWLWDTKGDVHKILITRATFSPAGLQTIVCGAKTPSRNSSKQMTALTRAEARSNRRLNEEKTLRQLLVEDLENKIANSSGLYTTEVPKSGGGSDIYYHNLPELEESDIRILISTAGITVTPNGTDTNPTWYGLTVDGNYIANILSAVGIDADWIRTGSIVVKKGSKTTFSANVDTGEVNIIADTFSLANGDTINSIASSAVNGQTQQSIFNILTNNGQTQGIYLSNGKLYLNGAYLQAGIINIKDENDVSTFYANTQTGVVHIVAKTFKLISGDTTKTIPEIANERASAAVNAQTQESIFNKLTNNGQTQGIYLNGGKLYLNFSYAHGGTLKLGGANNGNGKIEVYDESGEKIGEWTKDGLNATGNLVIRATPTFNVYGGTFSHREYLWVEGYSRKETCTGFAVERTDSSKNQEAVFGLDNSMAIKWRLPRYSGTIPSSGLSSSIRGNLASIILGDSTYDYDFKIGLGSRELSFVRYRYYKPTSENARADMHDDDYDMFITVDGKALAFDSSSSVRYKHNINYSLTEDRDYHRLLELPVAEFVFNEDHPLQYSDTRGKMIPGIIAEDVERIYPSATIHKDGQVESWDERRLIPGMLALIQEQDKKIKSLEERLAKLEELLKC